MHEIQMPSHPKVSSSSSQCNPQKYPEKYSQKYHPKHSDQFVHIHFHIHIHDNSKTNNKNKICSTNVLSEMLHVGRSVGVVVDEVDEPLRGRSAFEGDDDDTRQVGHLFSVVLQLVHGLHAHDFLFEKDDHLKYIQWSMTFERLSICAFEHLAFEHLAFERLSIWHYAFEHLAFEYLAFECLAFGIGVFGIMHLSIWHLSILSV